MLKVNVALKKGILEQERINMILCLMKRVEVEDTMIEGMKEKEAAVGKGLDLVVEKGLGNQNKAITKVMIGIEVKEIQEARDVNRLMTMRIR